MILKRLAILLILLLLTTGFSGNTQKNSITGKWLLICITDLKTAHNSFRPENYNDKHLLFDFKDDGKTGEIIGQTTSNDVGGEYELFENEKMSVSKFGGTKVGEHGWGYQFRDNIRNASSYGYSSDTLLIYFESDTKILKFSPIKK